MTTTATTPVPETTLQRVAKLAAQLRVDAVRASTSAGSGHPTSSMSAADLLAVLISRHLCYEWDNPDAPDNDHLIFSKGHVSPLVYAVFKAVGVVCRAGADDRLPPFRAAPARPSHPGVALGGRSDRLAGSGAPRRRRRCAGRQVS